MHIYHERILFLLSHLYRVQASTNLLTVNLFVLPYNYPMLLPLLDDLFKAHRLKPTNEWRTQFHNYLRTMPTYYAGEDQKSWYSYLNLNLMPYHRSSEKSAYPNGCRQPRHSAHL